METTDQIEDILKNKYGEIKRSGNRINVYFDLTSKQTNERLQKLIEIYNYLKSQLNRKVALNRRTNYSSIGTVDIVEEYSPDKLPEVKVFSKPKKIIRESRPGILNEKLFSEAIENSLEGSKIINVNFISSNKTVSLTGVKSIIKNSEEAENNKIDFTLLCNSVSKKISIKKPNFGFWTGANTLKTEVTKLLNDAESKGILIKPGLDYKFDPNSSFTGVSRPAKTSEISNYLFGIKCDLIVISDFAKNNFQWDYMTDTLNISVSEVYEKTDTRVLQNRVFLYVRKSGNNLFGKYRGFDARFASERQIENATMQSSLR